MWPSKASPGPGHLLGTHADPELGGGAGSFVALLVGHSAQEADALVVSLRNLGARAIVYDDLPLPTVALGPREVDVIITEVGPLAADGLGVFAHASQISRRAEVVVVTACDDIPTAVACIRRGAFDYILKPCDSNEVAKIARDAVNHRRRETSHRSVRESVRRSKHALLVALGARDGYTIQHCMNVAFLAYRFATYIKAPQSVLDAIKSVGELHDIGKLGIPDTLLNKSGEFTEAEREAMRFHPQIGLEIIDPLGAFPDEGALVSAHHERWDGSGYPLGLAGESIPLVARITAIADVFDACTTCRPYRERLPLHAALETIRAGAGTEFDPELADAFLRFFAEEFGPNGEAYAEAIRGTHRLV